MQLWSGWWGNGGASDCSGGVSISQAPEKGVSSSVGCCSAQDTATGRHLLLPIWLPLRSSFDFRCWILFLEFGSRHLLDSVSGQISSILVCSTDFSCPSTSLSELKPTLERSCYYCLPIITTRFPFLRACMSQMPEFWSHLSFCRSLGICWPVALIKHQSQWQELQPGVDTSSAPYSWRECGCGHSKLRNPPSLSHFQSRLWKSPGALPRRDVIHLLNCLLFDW